MQIGILFNTANMLQTKLSNIQVCTSQLYTIYFIA